MLWVGPKTAARLNALGVYTIGDLAHYGDQAQLQTALGKHAGIMQGRAQGQDDGDEVDDTPWVPKSVSHVWTFPQDIAFRDANKVQDALEDIVGQVVGELQRLKARGKTITLKVRRHDFYTITRAKTIPATTADFDTILDVVLRLYVQVKDFVMIRLLGVTVSGLEYEK
jgi:DNA polymerase-4